MQFLPDFQALTTETICTRRGELSRSCVPAAGCNPRRQLTSGVKLSWVGPGLLVTPIESARIRRDAIDDHGPLSAVVVQLVLVPKAAAAGSVTLRRIGR